VSEADKSAAIQKAEKLLRPKPQQSTFADEAAALDKQRRSEDEKTARLRALRLAKEAAEGEERNASKTKRRKRRE
jgi:hypothetical protein